MKTKQTFMKLLFVIVVLTQTAQGQSTAKGIKDAGIKSHQHQNGCCQYKVIYLGGSFSNPSASSKQQAFTVNTAGLNLDYSQTFIRKPGFSIGFNVGGHYSAGSSDPFASNIPQPYLIANQISSAVTGSGNSKNSEYFVGVGPQFNIHFANHLVFSPIFQVGYLGVTQSDFKATQTTLISGGAVPDYTKTYALISQTETKTSGFGFIPKARLTYMISKTIGIWAEASYLFGPTVKNSVNTFTPKSDSSTQTTYSVAQMDAGAYKTVIGDAKYNTVGFNFGIVFGFGGN